MLPTTPIWAGVTPTRRGKVWPVSRTWGAAIRTTSFSIACCSTTEPEVRCSSYAPTVRPPTSRSTGELQHHGRCATGASERSCVGRNLSLTVLKRIVYEKSKLDRCSVLPDRPSGAGVGSNEAGHNPPVRDHPRDVRDLAEH